jgi:hypothetical protein
LKFEKGAKGTSAELRIDKVGDKVGRQSEGTLTVKKAEC